MAARIARAAADAAFFTEVGDADDARAALRARAGGVVEPAVVEVFVADADVLVAELEGSDPRERILEIEPAPVEWRAVSELAEIAGAVGDLADLKSPFFHGHSKMVGRLASGVATRAGLDAV